MMSILALKWHELEPHDMPFFRSDNFVCVGAFFSWGGGGFCIYELKRIPRESKSMYV